MSDRPLGAGIDFEHPSIARMYDYMLGGAHNLAIDRALADQMIEANPTVLEWARENRRFLMRAVRYCADQGIRQFLDLGSGIPTVDSVHDAARSVAPDARVAYVDFEPVAVAYSEELLADEDGPDVILATYCRAAAPGSSLVLTHNSSDFADPGLAAAVTRSLDLTRDSATPCHDRDRDRIRQLFGGHELVEPGLVDIARWRSGDLDVPEMGAYCGVARIG